MLHTPYEFLFLLINVNYSLLPDRFLFYLLISDLFMYVLIYNRIYKLNL